MSESGLLAHCAHVGDVDVDDDDDDSGCCMEVEVEGVGVGSAMFGVHEIVGWCCGFLSFSFRVYDILGC